uniref:Ig-like domain-containing protein n=1 Tax=Fundulus heteroclitus TaxID=8078 RepID=A0A3Q2PAH6_FUNHE
MNSRIISIYFLFLSAETSKNSVHQTPVAVIKGPGESFNLKCNHSNTDFDMIQWYKQPPGKTDMSLLGYTRFTSNVVEDQFKSLYNVTGNGKSQSSLVILKLRHPEDSAVYFCAASGAQCCMKPPAPTKTFSGREGTIIHLLIRT